MSTKTLGVSQVAVALECQAKQFTPRHERRQPGRRHAPRLQEATSSKKRAHGRAAKRNIAANTSAHGPSSSNKVPTLVLEAH